MKIDRGHEYQSTYENFDFMVIRPSNDFKRVLVIDLFNEDKKENHTIFFYPKRDLNNKCKVITMSSEEVLRQMRDGTYPEIE